VCSLLSTSRGIKKSVGVSSLPLGLIDLVCDESRRRDEALLCVKEKIEESDSSVLPCVPLIFTDLVCFERRDVARSCVRLGARKTASPRLT